MKIVIVFETALKPTAIEIEQIRDFIADTFGETASVSTEPLEVKSLRHESIAQATLKAL